MPSPRVLIVDDAPGVGASIRLMLDGLCDAVLATTAHQALALLESHAPFDAVLCDLNLPDLAPDELLRRLAAARPELSERLVLMSGGLLGDESGVLLRVPSERRLQKPFGAPELLVALAAAHALPQVE